MFDTISGILQVAQQQNKPFWQVILEADLRLRQVSREQSMRKMKTIWQAMLEAGQLYTGEERSVRAYNKSKRISYCTGNSPNNRTEHHSTYSQCKICKAYFKRCA